MNAVDGGGAVSKGYGPNAADRYATLSPTDATRLTLQDVGRDLAKVGEMGAALGKIAYTAKVITKGAEQMEAVGEKVAAVSKDGKQAIYIEAKATTNPDNIVSGLRRNENLPARRVVQGTERYNKAQVDKMLRSSDQQQATAGSTLRFVSQSQHLITSLSTSDKIRIIDGGALIQTTVDTQSSGIVRPGYTVAEKAALALPPATLAASGEAGAIKTTGSTRPNMKRGSFE